MFSGNEQQRTADRQRCSRPDQQPFEEMNVDSRSGQMPGAVVTLRPGVAAASYVLNADASEKDIKKAASNIADDLHKFIEDIKSGKAQGGQ